VNSGQWGHGTGVDCAGPSPQLPQRIRCISGCNCETLLIYANLANAARFVKRQ